MAHTLNMEVTAEGIETAEQLAHRARLSCEHGQGYFLSRPLEAGAATTLLGEAGPDRQ